MENLLKKVLGKELSRRDFLKVSAAGAAGLALAGSGGDLVPVADAATADAAVNEEGKWVTAACWHNCGGRCLNKALVVDGVVVRQKTDDTHPDSPDFPQQRGCLRGRSQRRVVFGSDRLKYPMKRKHWEPGGGDKSLRGKDEWVRISWEEAYEIVASELKRIYEEHGPRSVLSAAGAHGAMSGLLSSMGGSVSIDSTASYGTWSLACSEMGVYHDNYLPGENSANDRYDIKNAETIVLYGCNPAWATGGNASYYFWQAKQAGARFVFVGPEYNSSASAMDAKWIRVRPGTDTAFLLSVAYTMITEDNPKTNPIIDWDFLDRCTVGFDADHMPEDATVNENFKDYVLGKYDGKPKTPEWAAEICGTPIADILWYAREMRKDKKVMLLHSFAAARCNGAEDLPQLFMTIGAMGGHMGRSGHATGLSYHYSAANSGTRLIQPGSSSRPYVPNGVDDKIPDAVLWKTILEGTYSYVGARGSFTNGFVPAEERDIDIRCIYVQGGNNFHTRLNAMDAVKAFRKVEFVVTQDYTFTTSAQYSDIVLPATTNWEGLKPIDNFSLTWCNREMQVFYSEVIEPLYEARSDDQIGHDLAELLGLNADELYPVATVNQRYFNILAQATVLEPDGETWMPLATITKDDIAEWGADYEPQEGKIGFKELLEQGVYQVERHPGDNYGYIAYEAFRNDPESNPRKTSASGKLEIYCQKKADSVNMQGITKEPFKPYPTYHVPANGYEESFKDWDNKIKGEYPFQVFNPHYLRRSHTVFDNVPVLREAFTNPVFISSSDAKEKGIANEDTVLIYSQYGKVLRKASLLDTIMPGCLALPHGSWIDLDEETGIDHGGCENVLIGPVVSSLACLAGYNTVLVNIEKYTGDPIPEDALKPVKMPKFA